MSAVILGVCDSERGEIGEDEVVVVEVVVEEDWRQDVTGGGGLGCCE